MYQGGSVALDRHNIMKGVKFSDNNECAVQCWHLDDLYSYLCLAQRAKHRSNCCGHTQ